MDEDMDNAIFRESRSKDLLPVPQLFMRFEHFNMTTMRGGLVDINQALGTSHKRIPCHDLEQKLQVGDVHGSN